MSASQTMPDFDLDSPQENSEGAAGGKRRYYYDRRLNSIIVWVSQGEFYVSRQPHEIIMTVLGSCIAVCMHDPVTGYGGMNHFLLPADRSGKPTSPDAQLRYGSFSIERLTNSLVARGACRDAIEVKIFGGGNILRTGSNLGHSNADFVEQYLKRERLQVVAKSLRGDAARRLRYYPSTGRAQMCETEPKIVDSLVWREKQLSTSIAATKFEGSVELFTPEKPKRK